jgi:hypothetical protein
LRPFCNIAADATEAILEYALRMPKSRVTITVDDELLQRAAAAVAEGRVESVSGWVNEAMIERDARDQRLAILGTLVSQYEAANGAITDHEIAEQEVHDRDSAAALRAKIRRVR